MTSDLSESRPSTHAWCLICRAFRPYRNVAVPPNSTRHRPGFDADDLKCVGCATTLLTVSAPIVSEDCPR